MKNRVKPNQQKAAAQSSKASTDSRAGRFVAGAFFGVLGGWGTPTSGIDTGWEFLVYLGLCGVLTGGVAASIPEEKFSNFLSRLF